jgi:4a-hydroxytetrahydrobiopterin dehydratase
MGHAEPLTDHQIAERLERLPDWEQVGNVITRYIETEIIESEALATQIVTMGKQIGRRADLVLQDARLWVALNTPDSGARLTPEDFDLAAEIDLLAASRVHVQT